MTTTAETPNQPNEANIPKCPRCNGQVRRIYGALSCIMCGHQPNGRISPQQWLQTHGFKQPDQRGDDSTGSRQERALRALAELDPRAHYSSNQISSRLKTAGVIDDTSIAVRLVFPNAQYHRGGPRRGFWSGIGNNQAVDPESDAEPLHQPRNG